MGTHRPGTYVLYNNWDFNALGTILERHTGRSLFDEFADTIARPAGMQDFDRVQQRDLTEPWPEHRTYSFRISARDLARFGQLYLCGGQHRGRTVISPEWVAASTRAHTKTGHGPAYGYPWWIADGGRLFAGTTVPAGRSPRTVRAASSCWSCQSWTVSSRCWPTRHAQVGPVRSLTALRSPNSCTTAPGARSRSPPGPPGPAKGPTRRPRGTAADRQAAPWWPARTT